MRSRRHEINGMFRVADIIILFLDFSGILIGHIILLLPEIVFL